MLHFSIQDLGDLGIFHCSGRMVAGNGTRLINAIQASDVRVVVLDLSEIRVVDAAGLGTLVALQLWATAVGRGLKLLNVTPWVENLLRLTNLYGALEVCSVAAMLELICVAADPFARQEVASKALGRCVSPSGGLIAGEKFCSGVSIVESSSVVQV